NARFARDGDAVRIESKTDDHLRFEMEGIPLRGPELTLFATIRVAPRQGFPVEHARALVVSAGEKGLPHPDLERIRLGDENREFAYLDGKPFTAAFTFRGLEGDRLDVEFCLESREPMWIESLAAYAAPDAMYREFEHGLVIANPGSRPYTFDLGKLLPGRSYRRIAGTEAQDPATNNGQAVAATVELPPGDALFLVGQP
ncbi:MAG: hypothetical protein ACOY3P_09175, partial [Planctomycetota bacterium]